MKSKDYWKKRSEDVATKQYKKVDQYINSMQIEYDIAKDSIRKDIEVFYARFAANNKISLQEARRLLNSNELQELKMTLEEFRKKAKNNPDGIWTQELNNVYYKTRVSRLEALQAQIQAQVNGLYTKQQDDTTNLLKGVYEDTYYRNIFEVHKGLGIGVNFAKLDTNTVNKVITEPWHGGNYSSRIWGNTERLAMELQTSLTQAFIRGDSIDKISRTIADRMNVAKNRATTLVNTESAYITSKATFNSYIGSGVVKEYEILATLDLRTSEICRSMDGKVFNISEREIGVNAPPFHPNCRTTTVAYFPDAIDEERIARDHKGNSYYVKGDVKYEDWYKENGFKEKKETKVAPINKDGKEIKFGLGNMKEDKQKEVISIITDLSSKYNTLLEKVSKGNSKTGVIFSSNDNTIYVLGSNNSNIVHEFAHSIAVTDNDKDGLTDNKDFWREIKKVRNEYEKEYKTNPDVNISFYSHSKSKTGSMLDEFMAEAFTHAILKDKEHLLFNYGNNFKYSNKVLEIVDKYFKKK